VVLCLRAVQLSDAAVLTHTTKQGEMMECGVSNSVPDT
jgi:hypothetical protein